jgi:hypothetical protein
VSIPSSEPDWDPAVAGGEPPSYYLWIEDRPQAHACWAWRHLTGPDGRRFAVVTVDPSVGPHDTWVLAPRHAGAAIDPPSEFPLYVHVMRPLGDLPREDGAPVDLNLLERTFWGVVVPTWADAVALVEGGILADEASRGG